MNVSTLVKETRLNQKLTQEDLSRMARVNKSTIERIERNITVPSVSTLAKVFNALNTKPTL